MTFGETHVLQESLTLKALGKIHELFQKNRRQYSSIFRLSVELKTGLLSSHLRERRVLHPKMARTVTAVYLGHSG